MRSKVRSMRAASSRCRDQRGHSGLAHEAQQLLEDTLSGVRIEIAGGLVGKEKLRSVGDSAGDGDPLLLATGELRGSVVAALVEPKGVEQLLGAMLGLAPR